VPKLQKLDIKSSNRSEHATEQVTSANHTATGSSIKQSTNPVSEMSAPSHDFNQLGSRIKYNLFADNPSRKNVKISNALESMKMTLRSESTNSYATSWFRIVWNGCGPILSQQIHPYRISLRMVEYIYLKLILARNRWNSLLFLFICFVFFHAPCT